MLSVGLGFMLRVNMFTKLLVCSLGQRALGRGSEARSQGLMKSSTHRFAVGGLMVWCSKEVSESMIIWGCDVSCWWCKVVKNHGGVSDLRFPPRFMALNLVL
jgi:hypothetical protein